MSSVRANAVKTPPYSVASEKIVVASILREPGIIKRVRAVLEDGKAFFRQEHGRLYDLILDRSRARSFTESEELIGALASPSTSEDQLRALADAGVEFEKAIEHAKTIAEKARMRQLIDTLTDILNDAYHSADGCEAIVQRAKRRLSEVSSKH